MSMSSMTWPMAMGVVALCAAGVWGRDASAAPASPRDAAPEPMLLIVLAGQSNMENQANAGELTPEQRASLASLPAEVRVWTDEGWRGLALGDDFGPELTFGQAVGAAMPGRRIGLVKLAVGGTSMLAWSPEWDPKAAALTDNLRAGPLYDQLMRQVRTAKQAAGAATFAGVLWMQGERDAKFPAAAEQYEANLTLLVRRLRQDLGVPALPFVLGRVHPPEAHTCREQVRAAQVAVAEREPAMAWVNVDDLPLKKDQLHLNTTAVMELGRRLAAKWLMLTRGPADATGATQPGR